MLLACAVSTALIHFPFHNMIRHISGEVEIRHYTAPASVAFTYNDVVTRNSSGQLALATATTPRSELLGLIQREIASADSDYASTKAVPVLLFNNPEAVFEDTNIETGTLLTTMVGRVFSLADEDGIDVNNELQKCFEVTSYISATVARGKFITSGDKFRLVSYQQVIGFADFTDGGSTLGTLALGVTIPAGAVFDRCLVTDITGFIGDTSAAITVGDVGGDIDRYNTGTPSVFTTAAAGADMGAPSGTLWHTAAVVPDVHITSNSDWGLVTAGQLTITLFWYEAD